MKHRLSFALALVATTAAAQTETTTTPHKSTTAHHATTATKTATAKAAAATAPDPADNPPGVPRLVGMPKPLYSLRYVDTVIGTGPLAEPRMFYTVHYTGWLTDGTKFDSSHDHPGGEPIVFPYGGHRVITGWDTGFEGMHVGGKRRLYVPYQLAYGESGRPPVIPAKANLIFDVELVAQSDAPPEQPQAPAKPAEPAKTAEPATPSGTPQPQAAPAAATPPTH